MSILEKFMASAPIIAWKLGGIEGMGKEREKIKERETETERERERERCQKHTAPHIAERKE